MKVLILTASTGHGHVSAAETMRDILLEHQVESELKDTLSFVGEKSADLISSAIVNIAVKTPRAFGFMYQAADVVSSDKRKSPLYYANARYAEKLYDYIDQHHYDTVLCPHLFPAEALTYLKRERGLKADIYFISTDYTCIPFLEELEMDSVFIPHADLKAVFIERGIDEEKLIVSGIPVSSAFRQKSDKSKARKLLGIPEDKKVFLLMTGGEGGGDAEKLSKAIALRGGKDIFIPVICGRNSKLKESIAHEFKDDKRVQALGFSDKIDLYMDACDVLLTKPGGISSTEAAVKQTVLIHTYPIPGVETENARFFSQHGMSVLAEDEEDAAFNALRLAVDKKAQKRMREAQEQYINKNAAAVICEHICELQKDRG